ncbi:DUF6354 family protein [Streptomyces lydicus]|uniref:DUF6354 family protein n=1 Tax=Streptomyces lydicus TaxID=47763 RepID=UPI00101261BF|nr:DUF6354 family protein [Streptomyces lydicus]MCZ1012137.1 DUF6354 family protein [Streptomyces lydicus]
MFATTSPRAGPRAQGEQDDGEIRQSAGRTVEEGQLYLDRDRYMADRDRRLRVGPIGSNGRASCVIEHDLHLGGQLVGRTTPIAVSSLGNPRKFELPEEAGAVTADPRYTRLLAAMATVHSATATPRDYARAAYVALALGDGAA